MLLSKTTDDELVETVIKPSVIVAGGGASGVLLASALVQRSDAVRVVLVEPQERLGHGMAYAPAYAAHLLNAPAARMSAFPDDPEHFVRWLEERGPGRFGGASFAPRALYGEYLAGIAERARIAAGPRLRHVRALATSVTVAPSGVRVTCTSGEPLEGDAFVLASGNAAPARWPGMPRTGAAASRVFSSAWDARALVPERADEPVLLLGTGLTAVDALLGLHENGHRGRVWMVSRRGLLPHEPRPETAKLVAECMATGRLRMLAGRTGEMRSESRAVRVPVRLRGSDETLVLDVARVINCSGPEHDVRKLPNLLVQNLLAQGFLRPSALGIGAEIAPNGALVGRDGTASKRLFAIGPVRFGTLIETTAIPEIAVQARELADEMLRASSAAA